MSIHSEDNGGKKHEETVALSREELGIPPETDNTHEETVALSREEMGITEQSKDKPHEATMVLSREEMGISSAPEGKTHEETVALSREEMGISPVPKEKTHEETVALSREEMGISSVSKEKTHEETVALSREEMGILADTDCQETIAVSREEMGIRGDSAECATGDEPNCDPEIYEEVLTKSIEELMNEMRGVKTEPRQPEIPASPPKSTETPMESASASDLEREFFQNKVKRDHKDAKYRFEKKIVAGGMGAIHKVLDRDLQRISAMKVVLPNFKKNPDTLDDFISEAKITGFLEHPNIIPVHEIGLSADTGIFFTMKLAEGEDLNAIIGKLRKGDPEHLEEYNTYRLLSIFRKVCDAVSFAHSQGILHRDIKPHNIMVGPYGEVLLMDWGIAMHIGGPEKELDPTRRELIGDIFVSSDTTVDLIKGTPAYMSPEQVVGELDERSDIFLLGGTLYHMFTLESPYFGKNMKETVNKAKERDLIPPDERAPARQIPAELCRIIMKAMAAEKEKRYQSADELSNDIDDLISGKWSQQEKKRFGAGEFLMKEGEIGDEAYLIFDGKVQVVKEAGGRKIVLGTLDKGDIVGEMSLIAEEARTASVEAMEDTQVAVLTKDVLSQNLKKLPPYMEKIVSALTGRLRTANANIHPFASEDCVCNTLKQLRLLFKDKAPSKPEDWNAPVEDIVGEISEDLGIPTGKVEDALALARDKHLVTVEDDLVAIPDMAALILFTEEMKKRPAP